MRRKQQVSGSQTLAAGCLASLASAALTCLLLFVNGSLVMALLVAAAGWGLPWVRNPQVSQFLLFSLPVVLTIIQWIAIDYVRTRFRRPPQESSGSSSLDRSGQPPRSPLRSRRPNGLATSPRRHAAVSDSPRRE